MTRARTARTNYTAVIRDYLNTREGLVDFEHIQALFEVAPQTVRNKIKEAMAQEPSLRGRIAGVFPDTATILDEVERDIGLIQGSNLVTANLKSSALVEGWSKSFAEHFCKKALGSRLNRETGQVTLTFEELRTELLTPYEKYLVQSGNGLVSIAGTLNQSLFVRALRNSGLSDSGSDPQFRETGTKSEGDIQVYHNSSRSRKTLSVEAKSYAARERLLRGLADIPIPKVGVGFFNDASEFGRERVTLMATTAQASALYMPDSTLNAVSPASRAVTVPATGRICRSLEREFVADMKAFVETGSISQRDPF